MVINCEHVWNEISNYLDDEVDAATRAAMEAHFKDCKRCTAVLDGTRNVIQLYGDDRLLELPAGFSRRLQNRLSQQSSSLTLGGLRSIWMLAVAAVALLVGGLTLGNSAVYRRAETRSLLAQPAHNIPPSLMVALSTEGRVLSPPGLQVSAQARWREHGIDDRGTSHEGWIRAVPALSASIPHHKDGVPAPASWACALAGQSGTS